MERDSDGNDITPDVETFLAKGSRRSPKPSMDGEAGKDIQETGMISDLLLTAERMGKIKRAHWAVLSAAFSYPHLFQRRPEIPDFLHAA